MQLPWRSLPQPPFARLAPAPRQTSATAVLLALLVLGNAVQWGLHRFGSSADALLTHGNLSTAALAAGRWWTPLTHLFLSTGPTWLLPVSLLTLVLAGRPLEALTGRRHLWQLFLLAGFLGGLGQTGFDALMRRDAPVAGPSAAVVGVLLALACLAPRISLFPWPGTGALGRIKVLHAALAALAGTVLAGMYPPGAGALVGGLTGCLYVNALGFGRRSPDEATAVPAPPVSAASSASWPEGRAANFLPAPAPMSSPLLTAPTTAARRALAAPRFTERERRMTPREFIAEKVDPVLEKISRDGLESLTAEERQLLAKAREKMGIDK